jgi:hypothetical protein
MTSLLQSLNNLAGFLGYLIVLVATIVAGRSMSRSKANEQATEAQKNTMAAMHEEIDILRKRIDDIKVENADIRKENARLQVTIDTIKTALKGMGLAVTIDGEMVLINDGKSSIATRIKQNGGQP